MLNIKFKPATNEWFRTITIDFHIFSGGEVHINLIKNGLSDVVIDSSIPIQIIARLDSSDELMKLLVLTDALRRNYKNDIELVMPYIPYARQDRACVAGDSFSLKVFTDIINSQNYSKVTVSDAHSMVSLALLNNVEEIPQETFANKVHTEIKKEYGTVDFIVSPDLGASKKSEEWAKINDTNVIQATKVRDKSGSIVATRLYDEGVNLVNSKCLIVDDICSGGKTFIELAKVLKSKGVEKIFLFVTHGIFDFGVDCILDGDIDDIYTTDSFDQSGNASIVVHEFFL
jgi:ribose-phosphate pyrophosphokinase